MLGDAQDQPVSIEGGKESNSNAGAGLNQEACPVSPSAATAFNGACFCCADPPETWSEVNTLRLAYSTPKVRRPAPSAATGTMFTVVLSLQEGQAKCFLFALSSRRKAYSHFYCRSSDLVSRGFVLLWPNIKEAADSSQVSVVYRR